MYILLVIAVITGGYFAFRYFTLKHSLRELTGELEEVQKDLSQNQMLHLPMPDKELAKLAGSFNDALAQIRRERQESEKREREFQKQIENISHDLRTPLTVILGYLKLLKKEEQPEEVDIIEQKAERLKNLITQFYDYSRINAGDYELKLQKVDIARALRENLVGNYQLMEAAKLEVEIEIPEHPVWVLGEETVLERIFLNLLQNAGRYARRFLHVCLKEEGDWVWIGFANDADELTGEELPHLFERFYMQDAARNRAAGGRQSRMKSQSAVEGQKAAESRTAAESQRGVESQTAAESRKAAESQRAVKYQAAAESRGRIADQGGTGLGLTVARTLAEELGGTLEAEMEAEGVVRFVLKIKAL